LCVNRAAIAVIVLTARSSSGVRCDWFHSGFRMQLLTICSAYADQDDPMRKEGNSVLRLSRLVLCTLLVLSFVAHAAQAQGIEHDDLTVVESAGAVKIKLADRWRTPETGMVVTLPATVSTGADGSIRLRQDAATISIAANTAIELLEGTEPGLPLQRVVQNQGSAFYDIAPRGSSRLRVETPWLVAVIKGTQFNVTVTSETSTVALFEGRLRIEAPDVGDVVDLHAGQIAKRHRDDPGITVVSMESSEPVSGSDELPPADKDLQGDGGAAGTGDSVDDGIDAGLDARIDAGGVDADVDLGPNAGLVLGGSGIDVDPGVELAGGKLDVGVESGLELGDAAVDVAIDAGLDLGDAAVDVGIDAGLDLNDGAIDLALDAAAGVGDAVVDVGVDAGLDLDAGDVDLGLDGGVGIGDVVADVEVDAGVDIDAGDIDLAVDGGLDLGSSPVLDVSADAGVDLAGSGIDSGLDVGADLGDVNVDTGLDTGIDLDDGTVDAGVDLGVADAGINVGIDLDLGDLDDLADVDLDLDLLDDDDSGSDGETVEDDADALPIDPGDLLDLLGF
jgi:hypothetical protein